MALKIRLRQQGRNNRPFYRLVVADSRSPRDGKYVEAIGWYNPFEAELDKNTYVKPDRIQHWLGLGAQMTDKVEALIAKVAPSIVRQQTETTLAKRAKVKEKRKARQKAE